MANMNMGMFRRIFGSVDASSNEHGLLFGFEPEILFALSRCIETRVFLEIGIFDGRTASWMLSEAGWIEKYYGVDILDVGQGDSEMSAIAPQNMGDDIKRFRSQGVRVGHAAGDSRFHPMLFEHGSKELKPEMVAPVDMVFVDGDHSYESVKRDSEVARQSLRDGCGIIVWHDYGHKTGTIAGVTKYINEVNIAHGDVICLVEGTCMCFEMVGYDFVFAKR